mmetsp:Transcript_84519/g.273230  ORF Transcript_84519/g.273230 Transcript_84519/m.273230 type:complete len:219 (+) Transcript_84519:753-1409(+)
MEVVGDIYLGELVIDFAEPIHDTLVGGASHDLHTHIGLLHQSSQCIPEKFPATVRLAIREDEEKSAVLTFHALRDPSNGLRERRAPLWRRRKRIQQSMVNCRLDLHHRRTVEEMHVDALRAEARRDLDDLGDGVLELGPARARGLAEVPLVQGLRRVLHAARVVGDDRNPVVLEGNQVVGLRDADFEAVQHRLQPLQGLGGCRHREAAADRLRCRCQV